MSEKNLIEKVLEIYQYAHESMWLWSLVDAEEALEVNVCSTSTLALVRIWGPKHYYNTHPPHIHIHAPQCSAQTHTTSPLSVSLV